MCPKCGSLHVLCGSPTGPYHPETGPMYLFRLDSCLDCHHHWTVDLKPKPPKTA